jgi:phosphatidylinositol-3-phosphatase
MKAAAVIAACAALLALPARAAAPAVPSLGHVIVVVFENKESQAVLGTRAAPTFNLYARTYATLTRYYGVTHPSLPNYLALVSGSTHGITSDCVDCSVAGPSLADSLERSGRTWKVYAEGLPEPGFLGGGSGQYAKKHNPFAYFTSVTTSPARRQRLVPLTELPRDKAAEKLPDFALVVPDLCNSMHDCSVATGDAWLRRTVAPLLHLRATAIFIVFDEGTTNVRGGGHIPALVVGTAVRRHVRYRALTGHYGLLRTIEQAWSLPRLGRSAAARPITGIWRP